MGGETKRKKSRGRGEQGGKKLFRKMIDHNA